MRIRRTFLINGLLCLSWSSSALPSIHQSDSKLSLRHEEHHEQPVPSAPEAVSSPDHLSETRKMSNHSSMEHHHGGPVLYHFDPSFIPPDPMSYFVHDFETEGGHASLMGGHIFFMCLAWLGFLPLNLFLRTAKHPLYHIAQILFLVSNFFGVLCCSLYKARTPDLYEHNVHSKIGWFALFMVICLCGVDTYAFSKQIRSWYKGNRSTPGLSERAGMSSLLPEEEEYRLVHQMDPEEIEDLQAEDSQDVHQPQRRTGHAAESSMGGITSPTRSNSADSTITLHDTNVNHQEWRAAMGKLGQSAEIQAAVSWTSRHRLAVIWKYMHIFLLRSLLLIGYAEIVTGIVVYSGKCREHYNNGCLAHLVKGSIFLWWGLLTFGRYLGAWAELGWAWNKKPAVSGWRARAPSAEFVESFLIFFYGCTNTWMERFGAKKGDPFSVHQIQHISIAVLFWFAGFLGLLVESSYVRRWLSAGIKSKMNPNLSQAEHNTAEMSFNPFPAFVAAITGIAMSSHHQQYQFAIDVHALWGNMLVAFAVCRIATYAFLWLRPPASHLPSRPPTEALASILLCCSGVVFMLSTKQVVFSAMANGLDSVMTFLNGSLALVALALSWETVLFVIKGMATVRMVSLQSRA